MCGDNKISLDANMFSTVLASQMMSFQAVILDEHEKEVKSLHAEIRLLREQLSRFDSSYGSELLVNESQEKSLITKVTEDLPNKSDVKLDIMVCAPAYLAEAAPQDAACTTPDHPKKSTADHKVSPLRRTSTRRDSLGAPEPREKMNCIRRMVLSQKFEVASGCVILANTLMLAMRLQYDAIDIGFHIGAGNFAQTATDTWPHAEGVFYVIEIGFTCVFIIEYMLRVYLLRLKSFKSGWMWFDCVVIAMGSIDTFGSGDLPVNPGMLRVLRLVRLVRLFKILKSMQAFDSLFLLQKAIVASMSAAVWSFAILVAIQVVFGLFLNQLMQSYLLEEGHSVEAKRSVYKYFGTFSGTMLTMFEITMASWVGPCRVLVDNVSEGFILVFVVYRCFFCFAVLKVIAAVFITETNRVLQHDDELTIMKLNREKALFDKKVRAIVSGFAEDTIGNEELHELAYNEDVKAHMSTFGFSPVDMEKIFWLVDDGSGRVPVDLFLAKLGSMTGPAKQVDMLTLLKLTHKVDQEVLETTEQCERIAMSQF